MSTNNNISYVEFPTTDIEATKTFFVDAFGWSFKDYGPDYMSFSNQGIDGGFYKSDSACPADAGSALVVIYSDNLEQTRASVEQAGGSIVKPIFSFPGGRRFHFAEPGGNELAVWSDRSA